MKRYWRLLIVGGETNCTRISMQQGSFLIHQICTSITLDDADIMEGVRNCIYRLGPDLETQMECMQPLIVYMEKNGEFAYNNAKKAAAKLHPTQWWMIHGIRTKQLQNIAVRILSQTCAAASSCERN
ncbi:uncharacterized protein LOC110007990 [Amborella trichopoda]|uniref:uncharacterized protein LOC110007990 n=1 Tax=Amborella trichopoda TaxID=13333 RepID=UPI0009BDDFE8|nr:uncharacterized protein LOC110007990 [Amborella trichopoda]|eukprot:XP_020528331.1 uncharacterized protein LOC110007990 [Amborella trichopoda]